MWVDHLWMYNQCDQSGKGLNNAIGEGVEEFIAFALSYQSFMSNGCISCPCTRCEKRNFPMLSM